MNPLTELLHHIENAAIACTDASEGTVFIDSMQFKTKVEALITTYMEELIGEDEQSSKENIGLMSKYQNTIRRNQIRAELRTKITPTREKEGDGKTI